MLRKPAQELFNASGEDVDINLNRKLLKTILVKGEANISSATINAEGTLLVVSTASDIKAFRLQHQNPAKPSDVKLSAIGLPQKLTSLGATHVELSPDGRVLCAVQEGSRVLMASITAPSEEDSSEFSVQLQRLTRLRRHVPRYILNGGLGSYDRSITHVAFTADSKMVAVADLAGYVDTWVVHGELQNGADVEGAGDASSSSESDSSDSEIENDSATASGRWVRNPSAKLLPKLPSAPVVLSFSDDVPGQGSEGSNVTDYTLLAITASWNILAFHPRQGSLTPWARRHPRNALPTAVQDLLDLAKGVLWQGPRVWIYGVSFLLMLDMSQDLREGATDNEVTTDLQQGTKRKRKGPTSGAGGKMERENFAPRQIRKHTDRGESEDFDIDARQEDDSDESNSDDDMPDAEGELAQLRNQISATNGSLEVAQADSSDRKRWWISYKYRPVLGVVPLSANGEALEVALVERPTWDVDMPERYFGGDEWER